MRKWLLNPTARKTIMTANIKKSVTCHSIGENILRVINTSGFFLVTRDIYITLSAKFLSA